MYNFVKKYNLKHFVKIICDIEKTKEIQFEADYVTIVDKWAKIQEINDYFDIIDLNKIYHKNIF